MPLTQYMLCIIGFSLITGVLAIVLTRLSALVLRIDDCDRSLLTVFAVSMSGLTSYFGLSCVLAILHPDWSQLLACCFLSLILSLMMPVSAFMYAACVRYEMMVSAYVNRRRG